MAVPGAGSAAGGGTPQGGGVQGADGTFYVGGADSKPQGSGGGALPGYGSVPATGQGTNFGAGPPGPSAADLAAGEQFGAAVLAPYNPSSAYTDAFHASMGTQRQALDNALATSLQQLGSRRDAAAKVIATIPGQVQQTFQQAEGKAGTVTGAADKATKAGKPGGSLGGDANAGLYQADFKANEGAGKAAEPLLQLGATANYDLGASGLQQQHLAGVSGLEQQQQAFDQQMAAQQQSEAFQTQQNNQQFLQHLLTTPPPETFGQKQDLAGIDPTTGIPFSVEAKGQGVNPKTGLTPYETAQTQLRADDQAKKAGWSGVSGQQNADKTAPSLLKYLQTGVSTAAPGHGGAAKVEVKTIQDQVRHDPDLAKWFIDRGFGDLVGAVVDPATGKVAWK